MMTETEMNTALIPLMNGKVYMHIYLAHFMKTYTLSRSYYTVKDGKVYYIGSSGDLCPTEDKLLNTKLECVCIGDYVPGKKYPAVNKQLSFSQVNKLFK
jgi:hypothetical protein